MRETLSLLALATNSDICLSRG